MGSNMKTIQQQQQQPFTPSHTFKALRKENDLNLIKANNNSSKIVITPENTFINNKTYKLPLSYMGKSVNNKMLRKEKRLKRNIIKATIKPLSTSSSTSMMPVSFKNSDLVDTAMVMIDDTNNIYKQSEQEKIEVERRRRSRKNNKKKNLQIKYYNNNNGNMKIYDSSKENSNLILFNKTKKNSKNRTIKYQNKWKELAITHNGNVIHDTASIKSSILKSNRQTSSQSITKYNIEQEYIRNIDNKSEWISFIPTKTQCINRINKIINDNEKSLKHKRIRKSLSKEVKKTIDDHEVVHRENTAGNIKLNKKQLNQAKQLIELPEKLEQPIKAVTMQQFEQNFNNAPMNNHDYPAYEIHDDNDGHVNIDNAERADLKLWNWQKSHNITQHPHFDYSRTEYNFHNGLATYNEKDSIASENINSFSGVSGSFSNGDDDVDDDGNVIVGNSGINTENYDKIIYSTIELECVAGYDGGLQQHFYLEAYDSKTKKLRLNTTSTVIDLPIFRIDLTDLIPMDLVPDPNPGLHLVVYSLNQKGRSEPIVLENIPINEEKRTDARLSLSVLPLAALLAGALFTVSIAILLVVVIAVRRRRCQDGRNLCDDKDKHLGMDVTVTAPLESSAGHQRLVVAYTLKQGVEKQPDILNAQKPMTPSGCASSSLLGVRSNSSNMFMTNIIPDSPTKNCIESSFATGYKTNMAVDTDYKNNTINKAEKQQELGCILPQSSTLKLGTDTQHNMANSQTSWLYDTLPLNRQNLSRYDSLSINTKNYFGGRNGVCASSNSTVDSVESTSITALNANSSNQFTGLMFNNLSSESCSNGTNHHTLPHLSNRLSYQLNLESLNHQSKESLAIKSKQHQKQQQQHLSITDYLNTNSLIDYSLSASSKMSGVMPKNVLNNRLTNVMDTNTITRQKSIQADHNHIVTDSLPGPESCV